jgi:hypothetical protein
VVHFSEKLLVAMVIRSATDGAELFEIVHRYEKYGAGGAGHCSDSWQHQR